jgi:hypothetical protein
MKTAALGVALIAWTISLVASSSAASANQADDLFQKAVAAEQSGDFAACDRLIAATLKVAPNYNLARWHSGQVLHNGKWNALEKIEEAVAHDPRYQQYADRVANGEDSLGAHVELARWCRTEGLQLEEQWHWLNVLRHDAKNREALGALKLRPYRGMYLTAEQIKRSEAAEKQAEADFKRYSKLIKSAMRDVETSEGVARDAALKKIANIDNPAAISPLVSVVMADAKNEQRILSKLGTVKGEQLLRQLQLAGVAALARMPEYEATLNLLQISLYASDKGIRTEAARSLKLREPTGYMPILMGGLVAPLELDVTVNTLPNGQITVFEDLSEEGPLASQKHTRTSSYLTQHATNVTKDSVGIPRGGPSVPTIRQQGIGLIWSDRARDFNNAALQIANTQDRVDAENAIREERNSRIRDVLMAATGKELGKDPQAWWEDWKEYNELYTEETPTYETQETYDYSRYVETPVYQREYYTLPQYPHKLERPPTRTRSCFVAGTPVWTQAGMVPIEQIKIGDLVLSQNPHTGELNYRPVVDRTVRPPTGTIKLGIDQEAIVATRGHRFWTADKGWVMAKFLKPRQQLASAKGLIELRTTDAGTEAEAYNLEVADFHTYFVGEHRVLVHDNTCPQQTINRLPGVPGPRVVVNHVAMQN